MSCPHGSIVGIKCANANILSISASLSSSVSSSCRFGSACAIFFTECSAAGIGSDTECVSIAGDEDCFGSFFGEDLFGVAGLLCVSFRVPFAVTGPFFVKAALAVAYLRNGGGEVRARHAVTLDDEEIPWKFNTPPKYVRDVLIAIETANNHEREGARVRDESRKLNCLHVFGIGNSRPRVPANIRNFWSFSACCILSTQPQPSSVFNLIQYYACKFSL